MSSLRLIEITRELIGAVDDLRFSEPVTHVYNPLTYAWEPHQMYLERFGISPKQFILLGMNPGPFGMAQTGVPFGEVTLVRSWMGIEAPVGKPKPENPARPIQGFQCPRSEVSGARLWGWARDRFDTPERFFKQFFVINYCPLCFMEASGRNLTPDKLPAAEREPLLAACDKALRRMVSVLNAKMVIGVGKFAEKQAARALAGTDLPIRSILHPSPASPAANRDWVGRAEEQLRMMGILT